VPDPTAEPCADARIVAAAPIGQLSPGFAGGLQRVTVVAKRIGGQSTAEPWLNSRFILAGGGAWRKQEPCQRSRQPRLRFYFPVRVPKRSHGRTGLFAGAAARALFDRASSVLGYDLLELCTQGPAEELDTTACSQPALFVASLARWSSSSRIRPSWSTAWRGRGPEPR